MSSHLGDRKWKLAVVLSMAMNPTCKRDGGRGHSAGDIIVDAVRNSKAS
jgi:hypothetical protein